MDDSGEYKSVQHTDLNLSLCERARDPREWNFQFREQFFFLLRFIYFISYHILSI